MVIIPNPSNPNYYRIITYYITTYCSIILYSPPGINHRITSNKLGPGTDLNGLALFHSTSSLELRKHFGCAAAEKELEEPTDDVAEAKSLQGLTTTDPVDHIAHNISRSL